MFGNPRPLQGSRPGQLLAREDLCMGFPLCPNWRSHAPRKKPRNSGTVAAAGVVNQADEQRILLPGYFTTPGLHPTHPLQASVVGPQDPGTWGQGGLGQLTVKDDIQ